MNSHPIPDGYRLLGRDEPVAPGDRVAFLSAVEFVSGLEALRDAKGWMPLFKSDDIIGTTLNQRGDDDLVAIRPIA